MSSIFIMLPERTFSEIKGITETTRNFTEEFLSETENSSTIFERLFSQAFFKKSRISGSLI